MAASTGTSASACRASRSGSPTKCPRGRRRSDRGRTLAPGGREHAHSAARAQPVRPKTVGFQIGDVSLERKIKEAIVALQIEKRYTKREILTLYANHVLFGHGTYGVEAASRLYFGKSAKDLTLEEAALLAGIIQSPARQSPFVSIDAATGRRNYALQRMADEGFITQAEAEAARKKPDRRQGPAAARPTRSRRTFSRRCASISKRGTAPGSCTRAAWR